MCSPGQVGGVVKAMHAACAAVVKEAEGVLKTQGEARRRRGEVERALAEVGEALAALDAAAAAARAPFSWVDGPLMLAMREGDMLLVDEINLAEDAVLERLNRCDQICSDQIRTDYRCDL